MIHPEEKKKPEPDHEELRGLKGLIVSILWFLTGKFLELDDKVVVGLLDRQKNEHSNIALVGALLMTITFSYLPPLLDWEDDWLKGAFAFCTSMCNCFVICAVSLSTGMLLCLNLLKDDGECRKFLDKLGRFELVPFQTLWAAICLFGFIVGTLLYYKLINYNNWFAYIIAITYFPAVLLVPFTVSAYMKALFAVRKIHFAIKIYHCDEDTASKLLQEYINTYFQGDENKIPSDCGREVAEFLDFVRTKFNAEHLSRKGICSLKETFEKRLGSYEY